MKTATHLDRRLLYVLLISFRLNASEYTPVELQLLGDRTMMSPRSQLIAITGRDIGEHHKVALKAGSITGKANDKSVRAKVLGVSALRIIELTDNIVALTEH